MLRSNQLSYHAIFDFSFLEIYSSINAIREADANIVFSIFSPKLFFASSSYFLLVLNKINAVFIPIGDDQIIGGSKPLFSYGFIVLNILIFLLQVATPGQLICEFAAIPDNILNGNAYLTLLTSMFMHGGWMHLIGNMMFLWVFADNIEQVIGNFNFLAFYLLGGLAGSLAHIYLSQGGDAISCCTPCHDINPCNLGAQMQACARFTPSLGASGAISAILGAYLVMFPKSKIKILILVIFRSFKLPAMVFLGIWFLQQLIPGMGAFTGGSDGGGVAWWAHIGGFVFGALVGLYARKSYDLGPDLTSNEGPGDYV